MSVLAILLASAIAAATAGAEAGDVSRVCFSLTDCRELSCGGTERASGRAIVRGGAVVVDLEQATAGDVREVELVELRNGGRSVGRTVATRRVAVDVSKAALRFDDVEAGEYVVLAKGDDAWERRGVRVAVEAASDAAVSLRVVPFSFRARLGDGGRPLSGMVELTSRDARWSAPLAIGPDGEASLRLWQGGDFHAVVAAAGVTPFRERRTLPDAEDAEWAFEVPDREIVAVVLDSATGKPVPRAGLAVRMKSDEGYELSVQGETDAHGTFRFAPVAYGTHAIKAAAKEYTITETTYSFHEPEQSRRVVLRLDRGAMLRLRIVDSRGLPVAGARILEFRGMTQVNRTTTDPAGATSIVCVEGDSRDVWIVPRDGSFAASTLQCGVSEHTVRVPDGASRIAVRAETQRGEPIAGIGLVVRHNGRAIPYEVLQSLAETQGARIVSDGEGGIVFRFMPAGLYELWPAGSREEIRAIASGLGADPAVRLVAAPGENRVTMTFARR